MELGPFWVEAADSVLYKITRNDFAWTKEYNILFVDQPVGTGLSYADTQNSKDPFVHNMDGIKFFTQTLLMISTMLSINCITTLKDASKT